MTVEDLVLICRDENKFPGNMKVRMAIGTQVFDVMTEDAGDSSRFVDPATTILISLIPIEEA